MSILLSTRVYLSKFKRGVSEWVVSRRLLRVNTNTMVVLWGCTAPPENKMSSVRIYTRNCSWRSVLLHLVWSKRGFEKSTMDEKGSQRKTNKESKNRNDIFKKRLGGWHHFRMLEGREMIACHSASCLCLSQSDSDTWQQAQLWSGKVSPLRSV